MPRSLWLPLRALRPACAEVNGITERGDGPMDSEQRLLWPDSSQEGRT